MPASKDPYRFFRIEAAELQEQLGQGILALEQGADPEGTLALLLRLAHTLKGAARVVKLPAIADHAHSIEDILAPLRDSQGAGVERGQIEALLGLHDAIGQKLANLGAAPGDAPVPAAAPQAVPVMPAAPAVAAVMPPTVAAPLPSGAPSPLPPAPAALRNDDGDLDSLIGAVAQAHQQLGLLRRSLEQQMQVQHQQQQQASLGGVLEDALDQMARELEQVRDSAERLRLTTAARLFMPLQRTVRDAGHDLGKEVQFEGQGGEVRLDGEVLSLVQGALVQMVRNAVAHGIEPALERIASGKAPQGRVTVRVWRMGRRVAFECSDDGAGVNYEALRLKALAKGWIAPDARVDDPQAALALLLRGGLSTAAAVNELAGRGVGLDVVRDAATRLGGEVKLRTEAGKGTTLSLIVPMRMAALEVLTVEAAGIPMAIPLDAVRKTLRLSPEDVAASARGNTIAFEGRSVPFVAMADALGLAGRHNGHTQSHAADPNQPQRVSAVLIEAESGQAALAVERIIGTAHFTLKPAPELVPPHAVVAGVSVDVEGRPQLVLDPDGLAGFARAMLPKATASATVNLPLLVIDDSLTTRMLEQSILESAGYTVHAAVSAEEGMALARQTQYALFLCDVEMPGMDGFTFVERTRADPQLRDVPVVLVTSLSSPEDKKRGAEAGASGYIVKGEFAQTEFLQLVQQLVQRSGISQPLH